MFLLFQHRMSLTLLFYAKSADGVTITLELPIEVVFYMKTKFNVVHSHRLITVSFGRKYKLQYTMSLVVLMRNSVRSN